jgi:hypothetical protein
MFGHAMCLPIGVLAGILRAGGEIECGTFWNAFLFVEMKKARESRLTHATSVRMMH